MSSGDTMDLKGGVLIVHQIDDGKHHYEVDKVVKYNNTAGQKMFVRRGDKLLQINGVDLQDVTPEVLAQLLAEGNPMLTVHKVGKKKQPTDWSYPAKETFHPISKEFTMLCFNMEMKKEEDLMGPEEKGKEDGGLEEEVCQTEDEEDRDLLIISMNNTSISVVTGRGCDTGSHCQGCHETGCIYNDVVMVSEYSTVTVVPRGSYRQDKPLVASIEHVASHYYLRAICSQKTLFASPNPERITIYHYKSNIVDKVFRGMPVVLNFTDSNCFVRCCKDGGKVFLQVETCEKQKLKQISQSDEQALSFVFYMKSDPSKNLRFESVLYQDWFIQILNTEVGPTMKTLTGDREDPSFLFIIQK